MAVFDEDVRCRKHFSAKTMDVPDGSIRDASVAANADLAVTKMRHQYRPTHRQTGNVAALRDRIHIAYGDGSIEWFSIVVDTPPSSGSYSVDLQVNGVSVLSSVITVDNATAGDTVIDGTVTTPDYSAGDLVEVVVASVGAGTWGSGLTAQATLREKAE